MKSPETPQPKSFEEVSALLKEKRISYSDLPEILANLRSPKPIGVSTPALVTSTFPSISKSEYLSPSPLHPTSAVSNPELVAPQPPSPAAAKFETPAPDHSLRSQLAALDESLKREQRYRRQFEEASAKAMIADELRMELENARNDLASARQHESELQSQIHTLRLQVTRTERDVEALAAMKSALADAQSRVDDFASRLKEAELRGALAAHLESELTKARSELSEAKLREQSATHQLHQSHESEAERTRLKSDLESAQQALLDASNREETLHIQLAEAHGAISIARQIESELDQNKAELKSAQDQIAALTALLAESKSNANADANVDNSAFLAGRADDQLKIERLTGEIASLQVAKENADAQIRNLFAESSSAKAEVERQSASRTAVESLLREAESKLSHATTDNAALRNQLSSASEDTSRRISDLTAELNDLRSRASRIPELENDVVRIRAELTDALAREKLLQSDAAALVDARNKLSEIDAELLATKAELFASRQSESQLEEKLQSAMETSARVEALESELAKSRSDHAESLVLIEQLRRALTHAQESANVAQSLRAEISSQVITLREAEVRRQHLEAKIQALETEATTTRNDAVSRESELQSEITRLTEREHAAKIEIDGYSAHLDRLKSTIASLEDSAARQRTESEQHVSQLQAQLDAVTNQLGSEATALRAELTRVQTESDSAILAIRHQLDQAISREQSLTATIQALQQSHAESSDQSLRQIAAFEQSIHDSHAALRDKETAHANELTDLKSRTAAELDAIRREMADREAQIADLSGQLARAEADAAKVPQLEQAIADMREQLDQSKTKEDALTSKLAAIERAARDITTLLPKVSYGPDYQIRHASAQAPGGHSVLPEFVGPYRAPRMVQWIGRNPKWTLGAFMAVVAAVAAATFYFYQPSYQGLVDAPVKQLLSPVQGTVLTAVGEPGMSVTKGQQLFTIKNANDGRDRVRAAKEQTMALEEEIAYLESARAALLQRQIAKSIAGPSGWVRDPMAPLDAQRSTRPSDFPDVPADQASPSSVVDYLALRISEINTKLDASTAMLDTSKATLAAAEDEFRKNEIAYVVSPSAGAIQAMRVAPGTAVESQWPLAEIVNSEEAFIEAAIPAKLAESAVGKKVRVTLDGSNHDLPGEIVAIGPESGWNSKQTAVSLSNIPAGYVIADVWITQPDWAGDVGFASQIGRKAKVTLK